VSYQGSVFRLRLPPSGGQTSRGETMVFIRDYGEMSFQELVERLCSNDHRVRREIEAILDAARAAQRREWEGQ